MLSSICDYGIVRPRNEAVMDDILHVGFLDAQVVNHEIAGGQFAVNLLR
jgi:hypothetical protein